MRKINSLRDLFTGEPIVNPTLQELAAERPEHTIYEQSHNDYVALLPGDPAEEALMETHPAMEEIRGLIAHERAKRAQVRERLAMLDPQT
jgi:hypothetical protein